MSSRIHTSSRLHWAEAFGIGLPILRLFFESIPIPLRLDNLTMRTVLNWIAARAQTRPQIA